MKAEVEILHRFLEGKKMRKTPERFAMLAEIYSISGHFKADELYERMIPKFRVSRATVYKNLDLFAQAGLVMRTLVGNTTEYEKCVGETPHYHMVCVLCGAVKEFTDENISKALDGVKYRRFKRRSASVNVYGICYKCQARIKRSRASHVGKR